jgi:hypothetical protein
MRRILSIIIFKVIFIFAFICAADTDQSETFSFPIDVSVYDGQDALLITWSYPDSILAKEISLFVQKFGQTDFELLTLLAPGHIDYLDTACDSNERYFYKVQIEDVFGKIFKSDTYRPSFGTCMKPDEKLLFNAQIESLYDLAIHHIEETAKTLGPDSNYKSLSRLLRSEIRINNNWFENFPLELIKSSSVKINLIDDIIRSSDLASSLSEYEAVYRNRFLLNPDDWSLEIQKVARDIQVNWDILYTEYPLAVEMFDEIAPVRILGYELNNNNEKILKLYLFHPEQIIGNELYILSGEEYIDLLSLQQENQYWINVPIPDHWTYVDLMVDDVFIQTCPLIIEGPISYSMNGELLPMKNNSSMVFKVSRDESSVWLNELAWNTFSKNIAIELAGEFHHTERYSITLGANTLWSIDSWSGFDMQYIDSSFVLDEVIDLPMVIAFNKLIDDEPLPLEYIILDTLPYATSRVPDGGAWHYSESITFGSTNKALDEYYVENILPEIFVLYQNYPNPFNGQTRITFDLIEDATLTLYISDATGRIHDRLIKAEFLTSGNYNYTWNGEGRSTGIYFVTIQAQIDQLPPAVISRKMIYLK